MTFEWITIQLLACGLFSCVSRDNQIPVPVSIGDKGTKTREYNLLSVLGSSFSLSRTMKWVIPIVILLLAAIAVNASWWPFWVDEVVQEEVVDEIDWWENGVFYQIYPRSFMDDDNDGTGDIKGIISRLEHLKDLGVTGG
jgi:hypothetical protein